MFLLDTDHCISLIKGNPSVVDKFKNFLSVNIFTSIITAGELFFGAENSQYPQEK
jgi:tRNA(fMet)-specific endonuclease VapC